MEGHLSTHDFESDEALFNAVYPRSKQLDPHPGGFTFPLFKSRAIASLVRDRYFYELVLNYSDLLSISAINDRLLDAHSPADVSNIYRLS